MNSKLVKTTGAMFIFVGIYLNVPFSILGAIFDYPNILRAPAGEVLTLFKWGGNGLIAVWYAFALTPIFFIALVILVRSIFGKANETLISLATVFGVAAGLFQVLGLIRWVFVVPALAAAYTDPESSEATKAASVMVFSAFHQYAGVAVGEHLGQLSTAIWTMFLSIAVLRDDRLQSWFGAAGIGVALMLLVGLVEGFATVKHFDAGVFGIVTPIAYVLISIWMVAIGIKLLVAKPVAGDSQPLTAAVPEMRSVSLRSNA